MHLRTSSVNAFVWAYLIPHVLAQFVNVTIDDQANSPNLTWNSVQAVWQPMRHQSYNGGSLIWSNSSNAQATFKFHGTAIYYVAPIYPRAMTVSLSLDGGADEIVDLQDPSRTSGIGINSAVRWKKEGLLNQDHILHLQPGTRVILDAFMYTTEQDPTASSSAAPSAVSSSSSTPSSVPTGAIIGATVASTAALVIILILAFFFLRRRKSQRLRRNPTFISLLSPTHEGKSTTRQGEISPYPYPNATRSESSHSTTNYADGHHPRPPLSQQGSPNSLSTWPTKSRDLQPLNHSPGPSKVPEQQHGRSPTRVAPPAYESL
ncbi:hypothetical protein DL96DRAFT_116809 [Flagelloscypha sp. PMI_526]|nr:hypothetical protein DL96DRAFT_116809 [Flagelloscypha sp. PMI_526]